MRGVELAILKSWYWFIHTLPSRAYSRHSQHFHHLADFVYVASSPFSAAGTDHSFVKHSFPTSYIKHKTSHITHHTLFFRIDCSCFVLGRWSRAWYDYWFGYLKHMIITGPCSNQSTTEKAQSHLCNNYRGDVHYVSGMTRDWFNDVTEIQALISQLWTFIFSSSTERVLATNYRGGRLSLAKIFITLAYFLSYIIYRAQRTSR